MQKSDFKKGQTVYLRHTKNSRDETDGKIIETTVKSVGNKYITVDYQQYSSDEIKFDINDNFRQVSNYSWDWHFYLRREDIELEDEYNELVEYIKSCFPVYGRIKTLSIEQLRKIKAIIEGDK